MKLKSFEDLKEVLDFMKKISVLKGCGEQSGPCTTNPEKCECWRSASTAAKLIRSAKS